MALSHIKVEVTAGHEEQLSHFITVQMFFSDPLHVVEWTFGGIYDSDCKTSFLL